MRSTRVLSAVVLALGLPVAASAQILNGRITGTVVDDAGQPIQGAIIVADNRQATPPRRTSVSNEAGKFGLMGLRSGAWVLLVRNQRRGGYEDWSTPGGVIDADDASLLAGLTREVEEETGLRVREWSGPLYEVRALAPDKEEP